MTRVEHLHPCPTCHEYRSCVGDDCLLNEKKYNGKSLSYDKMCAQCVGRMCDQKWFDAYNGVLR